jgi:hypothetical protein
MRFQVAAASIAATIFNTYPVAAKRADAPAECLPGGQFYFGGFDRNDGIEETWGVKDTYTGAGRWWQLFKFKREAPWWGNPYITHVEVWGYNYLTASWNGGGGGQNYIPTWGENTVFWKNLGGYTNGLYGTEQAFMIRFYSVSHGEKKQTMLCVCTLIISF